MLTYDTPALWQTGMIVNNSINIKKTNNNISLQIIEHKKDHNLRHRTAKYEASAGPAENLPPSVQ
jgi:hypothetical protein